MPSFSPLSPSSTSQKGFSKTQWLPFAIVTLLFFLWAVIVNANEILMPHLKQALALSDFETSLIPSAFFMAYFVMALPAGILMQKLGYKKGILIGLLICAIGAFLFYPAADQQSFQLFLLAQFILASGSATLETAANPYATVLGPSESSSFRLNIAQGFNGLGTVITPLLGSSLLLSGINEAKEQVGELTSLNEATYRTLIADTVKMPYIGLALLFLAVALLIFFVKLPEIATSEKEEKKIAPSKLLQYPHTIFGIVALFLYVGAQVSLTGFMVRFSMESVPGLDEETASHTFLFYHLVLFMVGRFVGSVLMKYIAPNRLLALFGVGSIFLALFAIATNGLFAVYAVVGIGFFHSIMFPTIFSLAIKDLGALTKLASSFLVMAIVGGAIATPVMGLVSDAAGINLAYLVPVACYVFIVFYGWRGSRSNTSPQRIPE